VIENLKLFSLRSRLAAVLERPRASRRHVVTDPKQLAALASPARQEIVDVLARMGDASVAEVAAALGRPADGLYYHLKALLRVGLVVEAGSRRRQARGEALYRTVAEEVMLRYDIGHEGRIVAIVGSMLRLGGRDFRRALTSGRAAVSGPGRELWALRLTGWLPAGNVRALNREIKRLRDVVTKGSDATGSRRGRRLYAVTVLLTPLDHRERGATQRRKR
jgi:DNA-binding transcriptional ArsR family regulator